MSLRCPLFLGSLCNTSSVLLYERSLELLVAAAMFDTVAHLLALKKFVESFPVIVIEAVTAKSLSKN